MVTKKFVATKDGIRLTRTVGSANTALVSLKPTQNYNNKDIITSYLSPSIIEDIRLQLIELSRKGLAFKNEIQVNVDSQFSTEGQIINADMRRCDNPSAFIDNNIKWGIFLIRIKKIRSLYENDIRQGFARYGTLGLIQPSNYSYIIKSIQNYF